MKQNETIVIPSSTKFIKSECYLDNKKIKKVIFEGEDTVIGPYAFSGCENLTDVKLPSKLRYIPAGCFKHCKKLTTLDFPNTLEAIGSNAFWSCGITKANLPNTVISIEQSAFFASNITLLRANGVKYIGGNICDFCCNLKKVELMNIQDIPSYSFARCFKLEDIKLSKYVDFIHTMAFLDCYALKSLKLPNNIIQIDEDAFVFSYHPAFLATTYIPNKDITLVVDKSGSTKERAELLRIKCIVRHKSN